MLSAAAAATVGVFARVFTFVCVLISIVIIATNTPHLDGGDLKFNGFHVYSYTSALGIIGILLAYLFLQTSMIFVCTGNGQGAVLLSDFSQAIGLKQHENRRIHQRNDPPFVFY